MEQVIGIEPTALAWKAKVLPLYDTCYIIGAGDQIRTDDILVGNERLYH